MSPFSWRQQEDLAETLLKSRYLRRRTLAGLLAVICLMLILGLWPLAAWLEASLLRFSLYWLGCGLLTLGLCLLALYDLLAVPREERRALEEEDDA